MGTLCESRAFPDAVSSDESGGLLMSLFAAEANGKTPTVERARRPAVQTSFVLFGKKRHEATNEKKLK